MLQFRASSAEETIDIGRALTARLPRQGLVLLIGNLGAGKTTLAKGIIEGLRAGTADEVTSPSYTLVHEYGEPIRVYHIDLYRLDTTEEVRGLGLDDVLDSNALVLVEWGERFPHIFARDRVEIVLTATDEASRVIQYTNKSAADDFSQAI